MTMGLCPDDVLFAMTVMMDWRADLRESLAGSQPFRRLQDPIVTEDRDGV